MTENGKREADTVSAIVRKLRTNVKPAYVVCVLPDGREQKIRTVGSRKGLWSGIERMLRTIDFVRLDAYAIDGTWLSSETGDAEPVDDSVDAKRPEFLSKENENLSLLIRAQGEILDRVNGMLKPLVDGYGQLADTLTKRLTQLERHHMDTLALLRMAAEQMEPAQEGEGGSEELKTIIALGAKALGVDVSEILQKGTGAGEKALPAKKPPEPELMGEA